MPNGSSEQLYTNNNVRWLIQWPFMRTRNQIQFKTRISEKKDKKIDEKREHETREKKEKSGDIKMSEIVKKRWKSRKEKNIELVHKRKRGEESDAS